MNPIRISILAAALALAAAAVHANPDAEAKPAKSRALADILKESPAADWRPLDPANTLYLDLPEGRVVMEMAPDFAPLHAQNIRILAKEGYFDGLAIIRSHDNYVVQWGDPEEDEKKAKPLGTAQTKLASEFTAPIAADKNFTRLPDGDIYAPEVGFSNGFPVARDPKAGQTWLTHCYGAVGVARSTEEGTGTGSSLYVIIGHAPRHLDRNIAVVGRVVHGIELLSAKPRGPAPMGFYGKPEERTPIKSLRLASEVPAAERTELEVLRTDSKTFEAVAESRRNRRDDFYVVPAGKIELCNVPLPVRPKTP